MKRTIKIFMLSAFGAVVLSSCIKETFPQGGTVTQEQVGGSASALEAAMNGLPAQMVQSYLVYGGQTSELDMAYPALMIAYTQMLGDIFPTTSGYDHYQRCNTSIGVGPDSYTSFLTWRTLYMFVKSSNDIIGAVNPDGASDIQLGYLGMAYAYRALAYHNLWNVFEPVQNQYTDVNSNILGLTVPIVTEKTAEADGVNNPRVTRQEMFDFIMGDLDKAEGYLSNFSPSSKLYPSLAVVYGLKARTYLTNLDYPKAAEFARKAISAAGCTPLTQTQWEDVNTGFNSVNSAWMWYIKYSAENMGNLCNYIGWVSAEANWGYGNLVKYVINKQLYDRISDTDFRKHSWLDPQKFDFYDYKSSRGSDWIEESPNYMSIKFRPVGGDWKTYSTGGASDVPLMRIEEMYLIEAEALGVANLSSGVQALNSFMQTYRQPDYEYAARSLESFQEEVIFQKRIEFWGEGTAFFDAKRLKLGTLQSYSGTNAPANTFKLNAVGIKPCWILPIPNSEIQNNNALKDLNNPDPSGAIDPTL